MAIEMRGVCPLLQVFDMPRSLAFYRDVLDFEIVQAAPPGATEDRLGWAWLRRDGTELMLNTQYDPEDARPEHPDPARVAVHEDTTLYIGCPEVDAAYQHLLSRGVEVQPPVVTYYGMKQLSLKDPDGFGVCFQSAAEGA